MRYLKIVFKSLLSLMLLVVVIAAVVNFIVLTPKKRAAKHLEFVHQSITEMHPAVLDPTATEFQAWHTSGYQKTKALLPQVHSQTDEQALLNYYLVGYKDSHLSGSIAYSPNGMFELSPKQWAGWLLKATTTGYEVAFSVNEDMFPAVGDQLISCDNQPIDELLQSRYAPFLDSRWNLLIARDNSAKALTQNFSQYAILNRPNISQCLFKDKNGEEKLLAFEWQTLNKKDRKKIYALSYKDYRYPSLTRKENNLLWVNVSDFKLNSPTAYEHHQKLLKELGALQGDETLIFDLRLNSGGNSGFGNEILEASFKKDGFAFLAMQLAVKSGHKDALYRSSWPLYWSRDYTIKKIREAQGNTSTQVQWLTAINERLKKALENNEPSFSQKEAFSELKNEDQEVVKGVWNYRGKVIALTDKRCVSSCLNFMDLLKQIPQIQHWGEPTNADTVYTEVAEMWHDYYKEAYSFVVPVKQWTRRLRKDNEPYTPDILFNGNIYDDKSVEKWVQEKVHTLQ